MAPKSATGSRRGDPSESVERGVGDPNKRGSLQGYNERVRKAVATRKPDDNTGKRKRAEPNKAAVEGWGEAAWVVDPSVAKASVSISRSLGARRWKRLQDGKKERELDQPVFKRRTARARHPGLDSEAEEEPAIQINSEEEEEPAMLVSPTSTQQGSQSNRNDTHASTESLSPRKRSKGAWSDTFVHFKLPSSEVFLDFHRVDRRRRLEEEAIVEDADPLATDSVRAHFHNMLCPALHIYVGEGELQEAVDLVILVPLRARPESTTFKFVRREGGKLGPPRAGAWEEVDGGDFRVVEGEGGEQLLRASVSTRKFSLWAVVASLPKISISWWSSLIGGGGGDPVGFSAFAPEAVVRGQVFMFSIWACAGEDADQGKVQRHEEAQGRREKGHKAGVRLSISAEVTIHPVLHDDFEFPGQGEEGEDKFAWTGRGCCSTSFHARCREQSTPGTKPCKAFIHSKHGVIAALRFCLTVDTEPLARVGPGWAASHSSSALVTTASTSVASARPAPLDTGSGSSLSLCSGSSISRRGAVLTSSTDGGSPRQLQWRSSDSFKLGDPGPDSASDSPQSRGGSSAASRASTPQGWADCGLTALAIPSAGTGSEGRGGKNDCVISYKYDCFISYRVATDANVAEKLCYRLLSSTPWAPIVFWDKKDLVDGAPWEEGFKQGLVLSRRMLALVSARGIQGIKAMQEGGQDNVLLEYELAVDHLDKDSRFVVPVLVGESHGPGVLHKFKDFDTSQFPEVFSASCRTRTVRETMRRLFSVQGIALDPEDIGPSIKRIISSLDPPRETLLTIA